MSIINHTVIFILISNCLLSDQFPMDEDAAVIYGLGQKARAMCPVRSEPDETQFLVGTLAPRRDDMAMLHRVAFDEENNSIARSVVYPHPMGEVWQVASSPGHSAICATVHLQVRFCASSPVLLLLATRRECPSGFCVVCRARPTAVYLLLLRPIVSFFALLIFSLALL